MCGFMNAEFFSDSVKDELIDVLCSKYFNKNFGYLSKSEMDLLMFHYYLKQKRISNNGQDPTDYEVSKELGITQSRVRGFKSKDYLQNIDVIDWKKTLIDLIESGIFVKRNDNVELLVSDVNVMMELRNFLEEKGLIDEYVLNPKVFKCSLDVFISVYELIKGLEKGAVLEDTLSYIKKSKNGYLDTEPKSFKELLAVCSPDLENLFPKAWACSSLITKIFKFFAKAK